MPLFFRIVLLTLAVGGTINVYALGAPEGNLWAGQCGIAAVSADSDERQAQPPGGMEELERRQYKLTLLVIIVAVAGIFVAVLLLSLVRMGRARRRRLGLGQKSEPTKYADAWSMHRLKDDQVKDDREHPDRDCS